MKRKLLSVITALALCLSLLPGTAWAADETGVTFTNRDNSVTLTDGKFYVAAADNNGITQQDDEPTDDPYLAYSGGTLTVHGAFVTTANITVNSNLTITGDEGSSLSVTAPYGCTVYLANDSVLTLDGGVDFTANGSDGPVITLHNSTGTFAAAGSYSGDIVINSTSSNAPAVSYVSMDVKNSGSITITGMMTSMQSAVLNSEGDVSITSSSGPIEPAALTIKGANVNLIYSGTTPYLAFAGNSLNIEATGNVTITNENGTGSAPALIGTTVISAGGDVTISSQGVPAVARVDASSLTVKNAQNVTIAGASNVDDAFFSVPVTFENCGSVTVEDAEENNSFLKEGVTLTSDVPVYVTKGGKDNNYIYTDGKLWFDQGDAAKENSIKPNPSPNFPPMVWKAGNGWVFYEPPTDEDPAKLTLDNAEYPDGAIGLNTDVSVEVKGRNHIGRIHVEKTGSMKLNIQGGATLNAFVTDNSNRENDDETSVTVYGKAELPNNGYYVGEGSPYKAYWTIPQGTELTIPSGMNLDIYDTAYLDNRGTLVNNGTVILTGNAAKGNVAQTIKSLGLTGIGTVIAGELDPDNGTVTVQETYFNSGVKLLAPAGSLDLNNVSTSDESHWNDQGYKWEVLETEADTDKILKATLTLAEGFNATTVTLPGDGAEVTVKTEGDSSIGTLAYAGTTGSTAIHLTFEGGKLAVAEHINFSGDVGTSVTIANGAVVEANKGITVSAAAGVDGTITVNGTLTARGESGGSAVLTGKISVGPSGKLEVYGDTGVFLGGKSTDSPDKTDFTGAFLLSPGGRFTGSCETDIIAAQRNNGGELDGSLKAEDAIVIPNGYLPQGLAPVFNGDRTKLSIPGGGAFNISVDNVPPSGGGGWVGPSTYTVTVEESTHGTVTSDRRTASRGDTVTLTVTADSGCALNTLTVTDSQGNEIELTAQGDGKYTFTMPGRAVTVRAAFISSACTGGADCPSRAFSDLDTGKWYHEAVDYVLRNDLMDGYDNGLFGPDDTLTRAQFVQILFNKEGRPAVNYLLRYDDAAPGAWYTEAVRWAASLGIAGGYGNGMFGPNDNITREQLAVMLWRYTGSPAATEKELRFTDADKVSGYALEALRWAVEKGIINGKGSGILDPTGPATRAETAQILRSFMEK